MADDATEQVKNSWWSCLIKAKSMLLALSLAGLLATNIATLMCASAHDWMHNALWSVLSITGQARADRALANSPKFRIEQAVKEKTADLDAKNKHLMATNDLQTKELSVTHAKLEANGKQAKETVSAVHKRLAKGVSRNLAALPSESVPYLGLGVTLAVTSLDIYDACQTMKDFNDLLRMMDQGVENPELCGSKVPTMSKVMADAKTGWRDSYDYVRDEAKVVLQMPMPVIRAPTWNDVTTVTCPIVKIPVLCN